MSNIMYRTEMSIDSPRKAIDVMMFEITSLQNEDILDYVVDNYNLPRILKKNINDIIDDIEDDEEDDEDIKYMLNEIIYCIEEETGVKVNYALWLAEKNAVIEYYEGNERDIYGYDTSNAVILSDLGEEGILFGYEEEPEPVEIFNNTNTIVTEAMIRKARHLLK